MRICVTGIFALAMTPKMEADVPQCTTADVRQAAGSALTGPSLIKAGPRLCEHHDDGQPAAGSVGAQSVGPECHDAYAQT